MTTSAEITPKAINGPRPVSALVRLLAMAGRSPSDLQARQTRSYSSLQAPLPAVRPNNSAGAGVSYRKVTPGSRADPWLGRLRLASRYHRTAAALALRAGDYRDTTDRKIDPWPGSALQSVKLFQASHELYRSCTKFRQDRPHIADLRLSATRSEAISRRPVCATSTIGPRELHTNGDHSSFAQLSSGKPKG